jgi:hypothetical protein
MRARALEAINKRLAEEQSKQAMTDQEEESKKRLEDLASRGASASGQREFLGDSTPIYEDYDKGIAVGGDPDKSAADILLNIRAQARAKGRGGSLRGGKPTPEDFAASMSPTGGGMTYVQDSPELRQREMDLKEWLAGGAERDAEYALSPEMSRRDPAGANRAAEMLTGLKQQRTLAKEQQTRDKFVQALADSAGKIPFEKAVEAEQLGLMVPHQLRGMSQEEFDAATNRMILEATQDMNAALAKITQGEAPPDEAGKIVSFSKYAAGKIKEIQEAVAAGQITRDEGADYIDRLLRFQAESSGVIDSARMIGMINQMQAPAAGE